MMNVRCKNTGLAEEKTYLSLDASNTLRMQVDAFIEKQIEHWNQTVPYAKHFEEKTVDKPYYVRHLIETLWRIRLLRVVESKAIAVIAKSSPRAAQIWANYEREEMLHDHLFLQDLKVQGIDQQTVLQTEPYLSTKLLAGYFNYLLDHESALGVVAYSYLVEYVNVKIEPKKLNAMRQSLGDANIKGQIAHSHTDINDDHPGEVWDVIYYLIKNEQDIEALYAYLRECQKILAMYFQDIYDEMILQPQDVA